MVYGYCWICDTMLQCLWIEDQSVYEPRWIKRDDLSLDDFPNAIIAMCGQCNILDFPDKRINYQGI